MDAGVHAREVTPCGFGLGEALAGVVLIEEYLPLEVGGLHIDAVDECEPADTRAGQEAGCGGSGGPHANDGGMAAGELLLAVFAYGCEEHLAGVALAIVDRVARRWLDDVFKHLRMSARGLVGHSGPVYEPMRVL